VTVDTITRAPDEVARPENIPTCAKARACRLYAAAVAIERRTTDAVCAELARELALAALDLLVEARIAGLPVREASAS
jgi:hypothetical protein